MIFEQSKNRHIQDLRSTDKWIAKFSRLVRYAEAHWLVAAMHLAGIVPLLVILATGASAGLGISTIGDIEDMAEGIGTIAMWFFGAMLACTPLYTVFGWRKPLSLKKPLALYAFMYTFIHMVGFFFAYDMQTHAFIAETLTSVTMLSGGLALLLMVPLAVTSNRWSMKRLGKRWKQLHKLTYVIALLVIVHLLVTGEAGAMVLLYVASLVIRFPRVKKAMIALRKIWTKRLTNMLPTPA